ncbi:MAG TPA: OmpA family protein [Acetobacteraceae bacterium]|jgi:outer membrane protein OmpA-like peptidoglycan-associated protein
MQNLTSLLAAFLLVIGCSPALAQVTVDPQALEQLQSPSGQAKRADTAPGAAAPAPAKPAAPVRRAPVHSKPVVKPAPKPVAPAHGTVAAGETAGKPVAPAQPASPVVPLAPPPLPVVPPPIPVPMRPDVPPPPATIAADAPGTATPLPDGLRITFGPGRSDLNDATADALRKLAHDVPADASFSVSGYAPGMPEDPSTPRRLSLSRVLTVRSLLIAQGIASSRIYPKALGASAPDLAQGPADRADLVVLRPVQDSTTASTTATAPVAAGAAASPGLGATVTATPAATPAATARSEP